MNSSAGHITDASINDKKELRRLVDAMIQQNASAHATGETASGQIIYDVAQGGYAASLYTYTPPSIDSSNGTPRSLSVPRNLSTSELFNGSYNKLVVDTGSVIESKAPIQSQILPKPKLRYNGTASDILYLISASYTRDGLNSEGKREDELEDDDKGKKNYNDFDNDYKSQNSFKSRCTIEGRNE